MRSLFAVLPFVALTFLCWGNYGPLMHHGQEGMHHSSLRAFIAVGLAYFIIAVIVPLAVLLTKREKGGWTISGAFWSLAAGAAGAVGALGIIMAFKYRGNAVYVMPLVFGCAPVVNTFVTMFMNRTFKEAGMIFYAGVATVAIGGAGVLFFKPVPIATAEDVTITSIEDGPISFKRVTDEGHEETWEVPSKYELMTNPDYAKDRELFRKYSWFTFWELIMIPFSVALAALSWGSYGPVLHKGQMKMGGSRMRPFLCVGLAYFGIAVVVPMLLLSAWHEGGDWTMSGTMWSLAAGGAGAVGALGIIMAFNFGGKPIFVMPLVFGCAPVVNTFTVILEQKTYNQLNAAFMISLALVVAGAVTVLIFAPKGGHGPAGGKPTPGKDSSRPEL